MALVLVILLGSGAVLGQPQEAATTPRAGVEDEIGLEQLCREGLLDPQARTVERKRWAATILSIDTPSARSLTIELLGLPGIPDVQRALCSVIAERARNSPERLGSDLREPLMQLLGAEAEDIRSMAAQALADFSDPQVPAALGAIAGDSDVAMVKRLAAVSALAPNTHRKDIVAQLIGLLDSDTPEIVERVMLALEPVIPQEIGRSVGQRKTWWDTESRLSEDAWQARQLQLHRSRWRQAEGLLQESKRESVAKQKVLTAQIHRFQREIYRSLSPDQREAKIVEWLRDPLPEVNGTALAMIKARIADEGKRPEGAVLEAVLALLETGPADVRRDVLEICRNLSDPVVVDKILVQLDREQNLETRRAVFEALGKLDSPTAVPAMIREIGSPRSDPGCVEAAAIALGSIALRTDVIALQADTAAVLANRYRAVPQDQVAFRAALLSAMSGVADPSFLPVFQTAVEVDDANVLREAIRGLRALKDASKLPRLRTLTTHADAFVRLEAIETIGQLGVEDADLEPLLTRLRPTDEPNERARDAAWRGFLAFSSRRSIEEQVAMAHRLREIPDVEARYLSVLAEVLVSSNNGTAFLEDVRERLATVLIGLNKHNDAVAPLRLLWDDHRSRKSADAFDFGMRLLSTTLMSGNHAKIASLIQQLAQVASNDDELMRVIGVVSEYVESPSLAENADRLRRLHRELRELPPTVFGEPWNQMVERLAARSNALNEGSQRKTPAP